MNTIIALFRGINVGGKNILPMKDLVKILEGLGCEKVKTTLQSGNAVFQCNKKPRRKIAGEISSKILEQHGFEPKVLLLEPAELQAAIENNPFETGDGRAVHFFFLDAQPAQPDLARLTAVKTKSEEFLLTKRIFYLYAPDGVGRSKLAAQVEHALGVSATARNWNTVSKLSAMVRQA